MCYVIRKYSRASDDRSFEGPLIRVPTGAEEFTQIAQLHIILIYFLHTYPIQDSVRYSGILLGSYRTAFQKYISMIFYLNKFLPPNFTSTCSRKQISYVRVRYKIRYDTLEYCREVSYSFPEKY